MTSLRTFRAGTETISTDPSERTDGDVTTWTFHPATGLELSKTYADNTSVIKSYDAYNRLSMETDARGNVKMHSYEHARGLHVGTSYTVVDDTAATAARCFTYNHLGQLTQLVDEVGVRNFGYNACGELETDSLVVDGDTHLITKTRDSFGRSSGYTYAKNGTVQHTATTGYGTDGRLNSAGFIHGNEVKQFGYEYLSGTNLLHKLTKPNNMTLTQTYEETRNLLTGMAYHRGSTLVAQRTYTYDILGRPTARNTARQGSVVNDTFAHNTRSELTAASVNGTDYEYAYDNIGNRQQASEGNDVTMYDANVLNQYTAISENGAIAFVPQFDADGNQTIIKTETGIWSAVYNAENRPVTFTNNESDIVVECAYDNMGRRAYKKVTVNGTVSLHQRYIYWGYLQIACIDLTRSHHPCLWFVLWDPTKKKASRPLSIQINGTWYTYGWDITKNICEVYNKNGNIETSYKYTPFGKATSEGALKQPFQWSSEYEDSELKLVYYIHRYFNLYTGRWCGRDMITSEKNLYLYCKNSPIKKHDYLGLLTMIIHGTELLADADKNLSRETYEWYMTADRVEDDELEKTSFADEVNNVTEDVWTIKSKNTPADIFTWTGGNWYQAREIAAVQLKDAIIKIKNTHPREKINIVAHSHGGNVVLRALQLLSQTSCKNKYKVEYVVLLGTPHFKALYPSGSKFIYYSKEGHGMIKKKLYNIYNSYDLVQSNYADVKDGISNCNLENGDALPTFDALTTQQTIHDQNSSNYINYNRNKESEGVFDIFGIQEHEDLHDTEMGIMVGHLLKGKSIETAVKLATDELIERKKK